MSTLSNQSVNFIAWQLGGFAEKYFKECDIISYMGNINESSIDYWKTRVQENGRTAKSSGISTLVIFLSTNGGSASAVEKIVEITRYFYNEVYFVILDQAMSAGTIWAMSGDKIYMNYASSLGPIDPQVATPEGRWVPALGFLDKIDEFVRKSKEGTLTQAELMLLKNQNLGTIRSYEQAAELSKALLKTWLVKYKFKDWLKKETSRKKVTQEDKEVRASEIAEKLGDNKRWHSHGRYIGIKTLTEELNIKIDDFSDNIEMCNDCEQLRDSLREFMRMFSQEILIVFGYRRPKSIEEKGEK